MYELVLQAFVCFSHSLADAATVDMYTATRLLLLHHVLSGICLMFSAPIVATPDPPPSPVRACQRKRKPKQSKEEEEAAANRQRELLEATAKSFYEDQGLA